MVTDATQAWFRDLVQDTQQRMQALRGLQDDPERFRSRVERDGVTVVVAPGGSLVDLSLAPSALRLGPEELSGTILRNQREAVREANRRYGDAVQDAVGRTVDVNALVEQRLDWAGMREAAEDLDGGR